MKNAKTKNQKSLHPKLRFPEFMDRGGWGSKKLAELVDLVKDKAGNRKFTLMSITSGVGLVSQIEKFGREIAGASYKNYFVIRKNDFAYNKSSTKEYPEGYIAMHSGENEVAVPNSIFTCFRVKDSEVYTNYLDYLFSYNLHGKWLRNFLTIGARAHGSLNVDSNDLLSTPVPIPKGKHSKLEQKKIADCLLSLDELIEAEDQKLEALQSYKKGLMQELFPSEGQKLPKIRFPEFKNDGEWREERLEKFLDYQQPTPYLVLDTRYKTYYDTPVLTAGKKFVLGYTNEQCGIFKDNLPVIIFDDFTTATQFVNFPFKAKSSAMKILLPKNGVSIKFMYEAMQMISYEVSTHERHWISKFAPMLIAIPTNPKEQQRIADFLSSIDDLISTQTKKIESLRLHKKGLMQQLFTNVSEVRK